MSKTTLDFEKPIIELEQKLHELKKQSEDRHIDLSGEIALMQKKIEATRDSIYGNLSAWQRVQISRHIERPFSLITFGWLARILWNSRATASSATIPRCPAA